jgi:hypothetical protein
VAARHLLTGGETMIDAVRVLRAEADECERLANGTKDRTIRGEVADTTVRWHWLAGEMAKLYNRRRQLELEVRLYKPPVPPLYPAYPNPFEPCVSSRATKAPVPAPRNAPLNRFFCFAHRVIIGAGVSRFHPRTSGYQL